MMRDKAKDAVEWLWKMADEEDWCACSSCIVDAVLSVIENNG